MTYTPLSRTRLLEMNEAELRTDVLIPLFRAMGFRDVHHHHGQNEKGKDIVMWYPMPFGREYWAAIVKADSISGQATTRKGSAGEVFMQVNQALGSAFVDPSTLQTHNISRCYVVTPLAIKPATAESLRAAFRGRGHGEATVILMGGDELWEKIQTFSPERTLGTQLNFAAQVLDALSPDHHVTVKIHGGSVQLGLQPKHANAAPATISAQFEFPSTPLGKAARQAFESHVQRGTPVVVPSSFIRQIILPEVIRPFFPTVDGLRLHSAPGKILDGSIVARHGDDEARLSIRFRAVRGGTDEVEIQTVDGESLFTFTLVLNRATHRANLTYRFKGEHPHAKRQLEAARLGAVLARGGEFTIVDDSSGAQLFTMPVEPDVSPAPDPGWIEFLEAVMFVQQLCRVQLPLPPNVPTDDASDIVELAERLRAGIWEGPIAGVGLTLTPNAPMEAFTNADSDGTRVAIVREEWFEVFGVRIDLGSAVHVATHMKLAEESRLLLEGPRPEGELKIRLEPGPQSNGLIAYTKWLTGQQLSELRKRLPGVEF